MASSSSANRLGTSFPPSVPIQVKSCVQANRTRDDVAIVMPAVADVCLRASGVEVRWERGECRSPPFPRGARYFRLASVPAMMV